MLHRGLTQFAIASLPFVTKKAIDIKFWRALADA